MSLTRRDEWYCCEQDKRFQPEMDLKTGYVTRSIICLPILNHLGHVVGVAQLVNNKRPSGKFTDKDEQVNTWIAFFLSVTHLHSLFLLLSPLKDLMSNRLIYKWLDFSALFEFRRDRHSERPPFQSGPD